MFPSFFKVHPMLHGIWIVYYSVAMVSASCTFGINFMPHPSRETDLASSLYLFLYDMIAFCGCRWTSDTPSFNDEFVGIRRKFRHGYRNMRQTQLDRRFR
jgi:hypothetical protein